MPRKLPTACNFPGCPELTYDRFCRRHRREVKRGYDKQRGSASQRGYNAQWRKARKRYLTEHPLCVECEKNGRLTPATVVDHIIPHKGDMQLFWDESNWQPLCKPCHDRKTATQDGRWNRSNQSVIDAK